MAALNSSRQTASSPDRQTSAEPAPVPTLDFSRQYAQIGPELLAAVEQVFASQHFILVEHVTAFEQASARQLGAAHAVGCASGTDALWLAQAAAGIGPGEAVVTTPFSFFATVSSILRVGAQPLLADIDPVTFNLAPTAVEELLSKAVHARIRAILPVHLYGQCADWDGFERLKATYGVLLLEDAAQAYGARWKGRAAGTLGDAAAFSFYPTKNLSAAGDAGMVTTNSDNLAERARMLRAHGMRRRYYHDEIGWNSRLDGLQAAVLSVKLRYIDSWNEARRQRAASYQRLFTEAGIAEAGVYPTTGVVLPAEVPGSHHVWHQFVLRIKDRDALRTFLTEQRIGSEVYYPVPLHLQESLRMLGYKPGDFPESERAAREVLALPLFPELREEEQQRVVSAIGQFLKQR